MEADESYFVLNPTADSVVGTTASGDCKGMMWADLGALQLQTRRAEQLITLSILSRRAWGEPARRALQ